MCRMLVAVMLAAVLLAPPTAVASDAGPGEVASIDDTPEAVTLAPEVEAALAADFLDAMRPQTQRWSDVREIADAARSAVPDAVAGTYTTGYGWGTLLHLAPDGRWTVEIAVDELAQAELDGTDFTIADMPRSAPVGDYRHEQRTDGEVLAMDVVTAVIDPASLHERSAQVMVRSMAASGMDVEAIALAADEAAAAAEATAEDQRTPWQNLFVIRVDDGIVLVDESSFGDIAARWNGEGPLQITHGVFHKRVGLQHAATEPAPTPTVSDPLNASLPVALARLLRQDTLEFRVTELPGADNLEWSYQQAEAPIRLRPLQTASPAPGTQLMGLPPDDAWSAQVTEVAADGTVTATVSVSRFSPEDAPAFPPIGMRFSNRGVASVGCSLPEGVPVRAKVTAVASATEEIVWDEDGFAFVDIVVDQGARAGLAPGDSLDLEQGGAFAEGRVRSTTSDSAHVTWRMQRFFEADAVPLPAVGDALVTPAWRAVEQELFGSPDVALDAAADERTAEPAAPAGAH